MRWTPALASTTSAPPVQLQGLTSGVRSLAAGSTNACALTATGAVKCWGTGPLGDGQITSSAVPVAVKLLQSGQAAVAIGVGGTACAVSTGDVKCWGHNYDGTLGNGTETDSTVPVQVKGMTSGARQISIGTCTSCALTRTGQVNCWGCVGKELSDVPVTLPWYR